MDADLSGGVVVAIIVVGLAILALDVFCIVDIVRRPAVLGGHKWVWTLVVLVFNLLGPLVYLAVGRAPAPATERAPDAAEAAPGARAVAAAELLYGPVARPAPAPRPSAETWADPPATPDAPVPPAAPSTPE